MIKNYIKIAWRNLVKRKFYSLVMIIGLSVGLSFALVIGSFVNSELSVNKDLRNVENQYMLSSQWSNPSMGLELTSLGPLATTLKEEYPSLIKNAYSFDGVNSYVKHGDKVFSESLQLGDPSIFEMYGSPFLHGDPATALTGVDEVVISDKIAQKYFGRTDVIDEILEISSFAGERRNFAIKGILDQPSYNSITHIFNDDTPILLSKESLRFFGRYQNALSWNNRYIANFVELHDGVEPTDISAPIRQILATNTSQDLQDNLQIKLKPLSTLHLQNNDGFVRKNINTLLLIVGFILFMAMINFVNISVGNSTERFKEIGIRKTLGGLKKNIISQFLIESIILTGISFLIALIIYQLSRNYFSGILGKSIVSILEFTPNHLAYALLFALSIGVISGLYPAISIAKSSTIASLKGKLKTVKQHLFLRRGLMGLQFITSLFVIGAAMLVTQQLSFLFNKDLGYNKEQIVHLTTPRNWSPEGVSEMITLRDELSQNSNIKSASLSYEITNGLAGFKTGIYRPELDSTSAQYATVMMTDDKYAETYGMEILHGNYLPSINSASSITNTDVVINESAAKALGYDNPIDVINQSINVQSFGSSHRVIGVVKDFHFNSMHEAIKPIMMVSLAFIPNFRYISLKLDGTDINGTLTSLETKWRELLPNTPFKYDFLDQTLRELYTSETRLMKAAKLSTFLSLVIVLMGILGLVAMSISRRVKEVGIRKVLGASLGSINWLFLKEFLMIAVASILIAVPLIKFFVGKWLDNFAYKIDINYLSLGALGLLFCLLIASIASLQILKSINVNPVESIRSE